MAIRKEKYFKKFVGINYEIIDPFSDSNLDKEDEKIRKNLEDKFSGYQTQTNFKKTRYHGSDGSQIYNFQFEEEWNKEDKNKYRRYKTIIKIIKTGNEKVLEVPCDLERFISERGFKKIN